MKALTFSLALALAAPLSAQTTSVSTTPVGYVSLPSLANTDTLISTPLARPSVFIGAISQLSGNVLSVTGAPGWSANEFVKSLPTRTDTYYVQFKTGSAAGRFYTVAANTATSLTVDWNGETAAAAVGDQFELVPYWTLGTLYPASDAGVSFVASSNAFSHSTEILFPDVVSAGTNLAPTATFYFYNGAWRRVGQASSSSFDTTVISPDSYIIQRNRGAGAKLVVYGSVSIGALTTLINAQGGSAKQDNPISLRFAGAVTLGQSNLVGSGAFRISTSAFAHADELFVYDNNATGLNKSPIATYYYYNSGWRKVGAPIATDFSSEPVFQPGTGVVIRKAGTGSTSQNQYWTYTAAGS